MSEEAKPQGHQTASFQELMRLAGAVGKAKKSGDPAAIAKAEAEHDAYHKICMQADSLSLGCTYGALY